jgi:hypothetical protein
MKAYWGVEDILIILNIQETFYIKFVAVFITVSVPNFVCLAMDINRESRYILVYFARFPCCHFYWEKEVTIFVIFFYHSTLNDHISSTSEFLTTPCCWLYGIKNEAWEASNESTMKNDHAFKIYETKQGHTLMHLHRRVIITYVC